MDNTIKSFTGPEFQEEGDSSTHSKNRLLGSKNIDSEQLPSAGDEGIEQTKSLNPEEDVCFPINQEDNISQDIDFEELDFFAGLSLTDDSSVNKSKGQSNLAKRKYSIAQAFFSNEYRDNGQKTKENKSQSRRDSKKLDSVDTIEEDIFPGEKSYRVNSTEKCQLEHRFSFFHSGKGYTVHATDLAELKEEGETFEKLFSVNTGVWWLDCNNPSDIEMKVLSNAFLMHPLTTEDIKTQEPREKVEVFKNYYFLIYRSFDQDPRSSDYLEPVHMYLVVFKGGILSFHFNQMTHPANVRRRIRQLQGFVSVSASWISYALIDEITDAFIPVINIIEAEVDAIEEDTLVLHRDEQGDMLRRVGECRSKVMQLTRLLHGKADVIKMFSKRCNDQWNLAPSSEIGLFLDDIQDHLVTMTSNLAQFETILARSHSNYLAYLSVDAIRGNNAINVMLGKITLLGTILIPMNVLTGLFGMNVRVPGQDGDNLKWFFGVIGVILVIVTCAIIIARWTSLF